MRWIWVNTTFWPVIDVFDVKRMLLKSVFVSGNEGVVLGHLSNNCIVTTGHSTKILPITQVYVTYCMTISVADEK